MVLVTASNLRLSISFVGSVPGSVGRGVPEHAASRVVHVRVVGFGHPVGWDLPCQTLLRDVRVLMADRAGLEVACVGMSVEGRLADDSHMVGQYIVHGIVTIVLRVRLLGGSRSSPSVKEASLANETASGLECRNVSARFHDLEGPSVDVADDVLEGFFQDNSMVNGVVVPTDVQAVGAALSAHHPTAFYPPEAFRKALPNQSAAFRYVPAPCGRMGILARRRILKGSFSATRARYNRRLRRMPIRWLFRLARVWACGSARWFILMAPSRPPHS